MFAATGAEDVRSAFFPFAFTSLPDLLTFVGVGVSSVGGWKKLGWVGDVGLTGVVELSVSVRLGVFETLVWILPFFVTSVDSFAGCAAGIAMWRQALGKQPAVKTT